MKIAVAQTHPVTGNIDKNLERHIRLIELAIEDDAQVLIFPELSLTGYEPELAHELATGMDDERLNVLQKCSDQHNISIGVGLPLKSISGITISMVLLQPGKDRQVYSKYYLHKDEEPYFVSGSDKIKSIQSKEDIALAICYELSIEEHAKAAHQAGAHYYIASVAKTADGVKSASKRLTEISKTYGMMTFMSNSIGRMDGTVGAGMSSMRDSSGKLIDQMDSEREGILIYDINSKSSAKRYLESDSST